jgi:hypothetical protein
MRHECLTDHEEDTAMASGQNVAVQKFSGCVRREEQQVPRQFIDVNVLPKTLGFLCPSRLGDICNCHRLDASFLDSDVMTIGGGGLSAVVLARPTYKYSRRMSESLLSS